VDNRDMMGTRVNKTLLLAFRRIHF
jgi:hypothetical protein